MRRLSAVVVGCLACGVVCPEAVQLKLDRRAIEELGIRPDDYVLSKRRYSCFFGTELEILLKALKADTLVMVGGFTDVCVHYTTLAGRMQVRGDYAIITVPFSVLRHVEMLKPLSLPKRRAIRQLHYDASAKILFQCRRRFWEEDDGIFGGGSVTDLAIRNIYYPEAGRETRRGVLLASYTWSEDAQRWGSLSPEERIEQALENVAVIHPQVREEFEVGASKMWHDDPFAGGAFALFEPSQQSLLYQHIIAPEGRLHFAGEHTSLCHAWIQGAIESGLRAALEVNAAA